jgi:hypothetical protein
VQLQKDDVPKDTTPPTPLYDLKITAKSGATELGHAFLTNPTVDNSGVMDFLVLANNTSTMTSIILSSTFGTGGVFGFDQTKGFQISEVVCATNCPPGGPGPGTVPLPAAVWLFGTVLAGGVGVSRWRKRRQARRVAA